MRANTGDPHIILDKDQLLTNHQRTVVVGSEQPVAIVEFDAADTIELVLDIHGDRKELATFMHSSFHVSNVADDCVAKHNQCEVRD
jgi:hypothetical protein